MQRTSSSQCRDDLRKAAATSTHASTTVYGSGVARFRQHRRCRKQSCYMPWSATTMTWQGSPRADAGELATVLDKLQSLRRTRPSCCCSLAVHTAASECARQCPHSSQDHATSAHTVIYTRASARQWRACVCLVGRYGSVLGPLNLRIYFFNFWENMRDFNFWKKYFWILKKKILFSGKIYFWILKKKIIWPQRGSRNVSYVMD